MPRKSHARFGGRRLEKVSTPVSRPCNRKRTSKRTPAETENLASRPSHRNARSAARACQSRAAHPGSLPARFRGGQLHGCPVLRGTLTRSVSAPTFADAGSSESGNPPREPTPVSFNHPSTSTGVADSPATSDCSCRRSMTLPRQIKRPRTTQTAISAKNNAWVR